MRAGRQPNRQKGKKDKLAKPSGKKKGGKDHASSSGVARMPSTGYRAVFARSLRSFVNDQTKQCITLAMPQTQELVGVYEVVRLMRLHLRFHSGEEAGQGKSCLLVSKTPFRLRGAEATVTVDEAPATMEQWVGATHAMLVEAGTALKASDLFVTCPKLKELFLKRFPAPGPMLKAGVAANVLQILKVPGVVFVQLRRVEMDKPNTVLVEPEKIIFVQKKVPLAKVEAKVELANNRAPAQVMNCGKKEEEAAKNFWICAVCEQENELDLATCILCLVERA